MKLNMISEPRVLSSSPGFCNYCKITIAPLCVHVLTFSSPVCVHVLTFSSPVTREWGCISELPSPFHQFELLVALASV
jgi:hypothetical protein